MYLVDFPYCCSAEVLGGVNNPKTAKDIEKLNKEFERQQDNKGWQPTLVTMVITNVTPEVLEALHASDWEDYVTWRSIHGNYPCTLFGKVLKEYKEPITEVVTQKLKAMLNF